VVPNLKSFSGTLKMGEERCQTHTVIVHDGAKSNNS